MADLLRDLLARLGRGAPSAPPPPPAPAVPPADAAAAAALAREAATPFGYRRPAAELLASFGGTGAEERRRATVALAAAGIAADPPLTDAEPAQFIQLRRIEAVAPPAHDGGRPAAVADTADPGGGSSHRSTAARGADSPAPTSPPVAPDRPRPAAERVAARFAPSAPIARDRRLAAGATGLAALAVVIVLAVALRGMTDDGDRAASALPPEPHAAADTTASAPAPTTPARTTATVSPDGRPPRTTATIPAASDGRQSRTTATTPAAPARRPARTTATSPAAPARRPSRTTATSPAASGGRQARPTATTPAAPARRPSRATATPHVASTTRGRGTAPPATAPSSRPSPRAVTLRIVPSEESYVCIADGSGATVWEGMLTGPYTARKRKLTIRVGVATARITANGRAVRVTKAPGAFELTPRGIRELPGDARVCGAALAAPPAGEPSAPPATG
ncbi:hypothetical protein [Conexibacter arvalis]|uniref:Uncharacterized protein n=1 Tax=Conexibacter arvalis TaxID=912552 RepID=A0A840IHV7_9ACTN|nr:hypothetical protein [Conexibacter arvalis]MBB4664637.1 hypothetical protein [Conexibacter arvalis]